MTFLTNLIARFGRRDPRLAEGRELVWRRREIEAEWFA